MRYINKQLVCEHVQELVSLMVRDIGRCKSSCHLHCSVSGKKIRFTGEHEEHKLLKGVHGYWKGVTVIKGWGT